MTLSDYPMNHAAEVSRERFVAILAENDSPAVAEGAAMYDTLVASGVSVLVFLGFYHVESRMGKVGVCKDYDTKNPGNVRTPASLSLSASLTPEIPGKGRYAMYPTWTFGTLDWCKRIKGPKYAESGLLTVRQVLPKYAPSSDRNDPDSYARTVLAMVERWGGKVGIDIIKDLTPHNTSGPRGHKARAVVWHVAEGGRAGVRSWFHSPASEASTHYLVCKDGDVIQFVDEAITPWANGAVNKPRLTNPVVKEMVESGINLNRLTISIETERYTGDRLTADSPMGRALAQLTREVMQRHGIPIDDDHVLGHNEVDSVNRPNCPGNLDWAGLLAAVKGGGGTVSKEPVVPAKPDTIPEAGTAEWFLNARGETVVVVNFGGKAAHIEGVALMDAGVTVANVSGDRYYRSVIDGTFTEWLKVGG